MKRVFDVARIQLVSWPTVLAYPLGLVAALVGLGLVIDVTNGNVGGVDHEVVLLPTIYLVVAGAHLQTMTQIFPFALGLSVTRRAFAAATAVVVTGYAMLFGLVLLGFERVERATGGWGQHLRIFGLDYLRQDNPVAQWLTYAVPFLACSAAAVCAGVVFHRRRQTGIYLLGIGTTALLAGVGVLATSQGWWPAIGRFLAGQPAFALVAGYPLAVALVLGGAGWLALRRATP